MPNTRDRECLPFSTSSIRTNDNAVFNIEIFADPPQRTRLRVQVVDWDIEEALNLTGVKVHRNYVIASCHLEHIGHELGGDRRSGLVFLVLTSIWKVRDHCGYAACRCCLAGINHDQKLHESIIDVARWSGLQNEDYSVVSYIRPSTRNTPRSVPSSSLTDSPMVTEVS
jgi:hypothetical protein